MKRVVLDIKYCEQCPFYKRVDENCYFYIVCSKTDELLYDENKGETDIIVDGISKNCPLPNTDEKKYSGYQPIDVLDITNPPNKN